MSISNEKIEEVVAAKALEKPAGRSPGALLGKAREARGLAIEDIAKKLFLTTSVVRQIENDNYQNSQAVTFMRGYLRSYARLVGVDAETLITEFNALGLVDAPPLMSTQRIYHRERSLFNKIIPWVGTIVIICVILAAILWMHTEFSNNDSVSSVASSIASTVSSAVNDNKPTATAAAPVNHADSVPAVTAVNNATTVTSDLKNSNVLNQSNQTESTVANTASNDVSSNADANSTMSTTADPTAAATTTDNSTPALTPKGNKEKHKTTAEHNKKNQAAASGLMHDYNEYNSGEAPKKTAEKKQPMAMPF